MNDNPNDGNKSCVMVTSMSNHSNYAFTRVLYDVNWFTLMDDILYIKINPLINTNLLYTHSQSKLSKQHCLLGINRYIIN
eukprot:gnl/Chilomastix_caulleri/2638.p1 GENE.gnl/Chilomastix_caulleri/2638~~gnl/Chilomastix_caulleri/2638.p1  ORF type:complete len:80 (+),score=11.51 gnl/Chilomastix_caulleri/2638:274-513(+)